MPVGLNPGDKWMTTSASLEQLPLAPWHYVHEFEGKGGEEGAELVKYPYFPYKRASYGIKAVSDNVKRIEKLPPLFPTQRSLTTHPLAFMRSEAFCLIEIYENTLKSHIDFTYYL